MFTIYSKDGCPFCDKAKVYACELVGNDNVSIINNPPHDVIDDLKRKHGHNTYPFIFVGNKFIGGYSDMIKNDVVVISELEKQFGFEVDF